MGALIGAVIGFWLLHGFFGALIGGVVGWLLTSQQRTVHRQASFDQVVEPLYGLLGAVAKADGRVSEAEIAVAERLMARMGLGPEQRRHAVASFNAGKQPDYDLEATLRQLNAWAGGRRDHAITILDVVAETVLVEGAGEAKMQILRRLAAALRISEMELMAVMAMKGYAWTPPGGGRGWGGPHGGGYTPPRRAPSGPDPYAVLGVARDADDRAIKRAYRKLISGHHPDRMGDLPEDLRKRAETRASEINAAYERIKAERGFK
jgi:DnaJ like chaperone protein